MTARAQLQTPPQTNLDPGVVVVATVNIQNPQIISQEKNEIKIGFDLSNQKGVQPQVRYLVQLIEKTTDKNKTPNIVDQFVYPESVNLGENQTIHREISYSAPSYLNGEYEIWILARNEKSLELAFGVVGGVTLDGSGEYIKIVPETCFLSVAGDENRYKLDQGVDVDPEEELSLTCDFQSNFKNQVVINPHFETYFRSVSGKLMKEENQETFSLNAGEKITKIFPVGKVSDPQAYDVKLNFQSGNKSISNNLVFHYVLRGKSATIQSFQLDKDSYQKGEIAKANLFWTGSVDTFPDSRKRATLLTKYFTEIAIADQEGKSCIVDPFKKELSFQGIQTGNDALQVPIIQDCQNLNVSVKIVDKDNNVLDENKFSLEKEIATNNSPISQEKSKYKWPIVLAMAITAISFLIIIISRIRKKKDANLLIFMLAIASLMFFAGGKVNADTIYVYSPGWEGDCTRILNDCGAYSSYFECCANTNYCWYAGWEETYSRCLDTGNSDSKFAIYNVSLNKTYYDAGETVVAYLQVAKRAHCYNGGYAGQIDVQYPLTGGGMGYTYPWALFHDHNTYTNPNGVFTFSAPVASAPGWYPVNFYLYTTPTDTNKHQAVGKVYTKWIYVNAQAPTLTVSKSGYGNITSSDGNINCGTNCFATYAINTYLTLSAVVSDANSSFAGWGGDCASFGASPTCNLTMNSVKNVTANFTCTCNDSGSHCLGETYTNSCGMTCNGTIASLSGKCGSAVDKLWEVKPNSDLCSLGTASDPTSSENQWCWNCSGVCGGSATECCAQRDNNWKEVAP